MLQDHSRLNGRLIDNLRVIQMIRHCIINCRWTVQIMTPDELNHARMVLL